jgi:GTP-binding protein EngB required for normal cell division
MQLKIKNKNMKEKQIDVEKIFCPNKNILKKGIDCMTAEIIDAELDILGCEFIGDSCVTINTDELSYITLTLENLRDLIELINKSDKIHKNTQTNEPH